MDRAETISLSNKIKKNVKNFNSINQNIDMERPIYITGLARSGTTIVLEMLAKHPDLASHQYKHLVMPYLPYWFNFMLKRLKISTESFERFHQDRIFINQDSPEAVEEIIWQKFFDNIHNEDVSNILSSDLNFPAFEIFYRNHIRRLLIGQGSTRYLAKNNYNITRLEYILKIFPKARFLVMVRDPISQIASLIKQHNLFMKMERKNPYITDWLKVIGHHEFGVGLRCINTGNLAEIKRIKNLLKKKGPNINGWAYYWNSIYTYLANLLDYNKKVKDATLIINYTDLCNNSDKVINEILTHTQLPLNGFRDIQNHYSEYLKEPAYYSFNFSEKERDQINEITQATAKRIGIKINIFPKI
jgi:hypothetical protein